MNLSKLNFVELAEQEMKETEGEFFGPFRAGLTLSYRQMWGLWSRRDYLPQNLTA